MHSARASNIFNDNGPSKKVKNVIFSPFSEGLVLGENDSVKKISFNIGVLSRPHQSQIKSHLSILSFSAKSLRLWIGFIRIFLSMIKLTLIK